MPTQDDWRAALERQLPARTTYIARSRAITALYARWYLQEPWLFKWAGLAAFASAQVGNSLALVEILGSPHGAVRGMDAVEREQSLLALGAELYGQALKLALTIPLALHDAATRPLLLNDLELIKQANDAIFYDIGWAHAAYTSGGIKALEANMTAPEQAALLEAFRMVDEGVHQLCNPADYQAGAALIQQGSIAMLRHEQRNVLPAYMERMSSLGKVLASVGAVLSFESAPGLVGQSSFSAYFGPLAVMAGERSVANTEDRWEWIERDMLPLWARLDAAYHEACAMHGRLLALANATPTGLQQTAQLLNLVYPALGLQARAA